MTKITEINVPIEEIEARRERVEKNREFLGRLWHLENEDRPGFFTPTRRHSLRASRGLSPRHPSKA
jgi:hypothetical protein